MKTFLPHKGIPPGFLTILVISLVIRIALPFLGGFERNFYKSPDTDDYLISARTLLQSGCFNNMDGPEIKRTPGYPCFLMAGMVTPKPVAIVIVLQVLIDIFSVILIYQVAFFLSGNLRLSLFIMALAAFDPLHIIYCYKLLSETLFSCLFLLFLIFAVRWLRKPAIDAAILSTTFLTLATFVRPVTFYLNILFPFMILIISLIKKLPLKTSALSLLLTVLFVCPLFVWQYRNHAVANYHGFSAIQDINLYFYNAAAVQAKLENKPFYQKQHELGFNNPIQFKASHPDYPELNDAKVYSYLKKDAVRVILSHPVLYAQIHLKGIFRILIDPDMVEWFRMTGQYPESGGLLGEVADSGLIATICRLMEERPVFFFINLGAGLLLACLYILVVISLIRQSGHPVLWFLFSILLYLLLVSGGPAALGRFRHPIMPLFYLIIAIGFIDRKKRIASQGHETVL